MSPIRSSHIIFCFIVAFIILILVIANDNDHPFESPRIQTSLQSPISYPSSASEVSFYQYNHNANSNSNLNRHEILQTKVKGYRDAIYWGSEHPIQEGTRYLNADEFERFVREEIEEKDTEVYWGAEY